MAKKVTETSAENTSDETTRMAANEAEETGAETTDATANDDTPRRLKRTFTMRTLGGQAEARKCLFMGPKTADGEHVGAYHYMGRVYGRVFKAEMKNGMLANGEPSASVVMEGMFNVEKNDGTMITGMTVAFIPSVFSEIVYREYQSTNDKSAFSLDFAIEIGSMPSGKSIPFQYEITTLINPARAEDPIRAIMDRAKRNLAKVEQAKLQIAAE